MRTALKKQAFVSGVLVGPTILIHPRKGWFDWDLGNIWAYRELLFFLVWKELKVRYKQTVIGAGWVILQPLLTMVLMTLVFSGLAKIPSDGLPYPVFSFTALLPWTLFASSVARGSESIVGNANLVTKVYFPRLILPLSGVISPVVDFAVAFVILIGMMIWYGIVPNPPSLIALPLFVALSLGTAFGISIWLATLNVKYRDVRHTVPFFIQVWMYASPVAYPASLVPYKWRLLYGLNPMAGVIEGFRWALLGNQSPDFRLMLVSGAVVVLLLMGGLAYFKRMESGFADEM